MEKIYTAYIKKVECTTYYCVKTFLTFPELENVGPVLESFGMHADFDKACKIARIDEDTKPLLLQQLEDSMQQARVINLGEASLLRHKSAGF